MAKAVVTPEFLEWWSAVRTETDRISAKDRSEAPRFNLFQVLGVDRDEVRTHSRLLAALLDPLGTHGQGTRFLEAFLRHPGLEEFAGFGSDPRWSVATEESHGDYGRFDIVLRFQPEKHIILIENKVDAPERDGQCADYLSWLETQRGWGGVLVFLTPDGRHAESETMGRDYVLLSYPELADLLETSGESPLPNAVGTVLDQYLHVTRTLNSPDLGGVLMTRERELADFLEEDGNLEYAIAVSKALDILKGRLLSQFFQEIEQSFRSEAGGGWSGRDEEFTGSSPYLTLFQEKEDPLGVSVQLHQGHLLHGIAWRAKRDPEDLVPAGAASLLKDSSGLLKEALNPTEWWLASRSEQMSFEDAYRADHVRTQEIGRAIGTLACAIDERMRSANRSLSTT